MHQQAIMVECSDESARLKGSALYRAVRAAFIQRGTSLSAWCQMNGVLRQNAERALLRQRQSKSANELRSKIMAAAGVAE